MIKIANYWVAPGLNKMKDTIQEYILKDVLEKFRTTLFEMRSKSRAQNVRECRQVAAYLLKNSHVGVVQTGKLIGRHHATVLHSNKVILDEISCNTRLGKIAKELEFKLIGK